MRMVLFAGFGLCAVVAVFGGRAGAAPIAGYVDDFNTGNPDFWGDNVGSQSLVLGGPAGINDQYLRTSAGGSGAGGALAVNTASEVWTGNYQAANITGIGVDFLSPNSNTTSPMQMRIVLIGPLGGRFTSLVPFNLPNDGAWHHATFRLGSSDLTSVLGPDTYSATIAGVSKLLIRYAGTSTQSGGTPVVGTLGLDNITALAPVPEPTGWLAVGATSVAALMRRRRRAT